MLYQQYRTAIFAMWKTVSAEDFKVEIEQEPSEHVLCSLCNPAFGAVSGRDDKTMCPFDTRNEKTWTQASPCIDNCQILSVGVKSHKLQIIMSKFMTNFVIKEGIESMKNLAKACKSQKGSSAVAAKEFVTVASKVIESTQRFGGFEFDVVNGRLTGKRRND